MSNIWGTKFCLNCEIWYNSKSSKECPLCKPKWEHKYMIGKQIHNHLKSYIKSMTGLGQKMPPGKGWSIKTDNRK